MKILNITYSVCARARVRACLSQNCHGSVCIIIIIVQLFLCLLLFLIILANDTDVGKSPWVCLYLKLCVFDQFHITRCCDCTF